MRILYSLLLYFALPFILARLYWKGRRLPAYRHRIAERFCLNKQHNPVDIWLHAVSLGEVIAATPLIELLLAQQWRVLVTTMTPTGSQQVIRHFGDRVTHQYVPYDFSWVVNRFYQRFTPRLGIIMETELWPNLIHRAHKMNLPLLLMNARLSDKAYKHYSQSAFLFKPILNQFTFILAQSDEDAKRFIALGASETKVEAVGNMKFDLQLQDVTSVDYAALKNQWGQARSVLIAASTHEGEEHQLLSRLNQLKAVVPHLLLVIAPRHPERFKDVAQLSQSQGFNTSLRSQPHTITSESDVVLIDTLGELIHFYPLSDYAFVGGSLVPVGGHNVLEPIALKVPVFCGPYMQNSKAICGDLKAAEAISIVNDGDELMAAIAVMDQDKSKRKQQVDNASAVLLANQGTVGRCMEKIKEILV